MRILCLLVFLCGVSTVYVKAQSLSAATNQKEPYSVTLRGQIESVEVSKVPPSGVSIAVKLNLELINDGVKPLIFLKQKAPLLVGYMLTKSPDKGSADNQLAFSFTGPGVDNSPEWEGLRKELQQLSPPLDKVRILMPNEVWHLDETIRIFLATEIGNKSTFPKNASWETIQKHSPVWLRINCQVWPLNLEPPGRDRTRLTFGNKLQRQWKRSGLLWLNPLYSNPIALNLRDSKQ